MTLPGLRPLRRFFRAPATIVGELAAIALIGAAGAILPQSGSAPPAELARLHDPGTWTGRAADLLGLDHLFRTPLFLLVLGLSTVSLMIVVAEQLRRLRTQWTQVPAAAQFERAPFRTEFLRAPRAGSATVAATSGRAGLAGPPLFHLGVLLVIAAGAARALFGVEAAVDLLEGEILPATVEAWGAQWPGRFAGPFRLDAPLAVETVQLQRYPRGELRQLEAQLRVQEPGGPVVRRIGINDELRVDRGRVHLDSRWGPAALLELASAGEPPRREAVLLAPAGPGVFAGGTRPGPPLEVHLRASLAPAAVRVQEVEARVLEGGALRFAGSLSTGRSVALPGGGQLTLHGLPWWVRLRGDRDPALNLAYAGFALVLAGALLTYTVVRVDTRVEIEPAEGGERVRLSLLPHRFAPLFRERFERLVREHGGGP